MNWPLGTASLLPIRLPPHSMHCGLLSRRVTLCLVSAACLSFLRAKKNFPAFDLRQSGSVAVAACAVVVSYHLQFVFALWRRSVALALPLPPGLSHETRTCTILKFCYAYHTHDTLCASPSGLSLPKTAKQTNPQHFVLFLSAL